MFIGLTRFSLFQHASSSWKASSKELQPDKRAYREYLFAEERLEFRGKMFFEHSIPMIAKAAEIHRIKHLVSYSESLPRKYRDKLVDAAERYDFLVLDERPDGLGASDWRAVFDAEIGIEDVVGVYRLDDDDLLCTDYFDRMRKYVSKPFVGMRASFGQVAQVFYNGTKMSHPRQSHQPMSASGLMEIVEKRGSASYTQPKSVSHNRSDRVGPVIVDSSVIGSLWVRSVDQDTAFGETPEVRAQQIRSHLNSLDRVESAVFSARFPTLAGAVDFGIRERLLDEPIQVAKGLCFDIETPIKSISFSFSYYGGEGLQRQHYVWSFGLRDSSTNNEIFDVDIDGLTKASSNGFRNYRYSRATAGQGTARVQLSLPQGVVCDQIRIFPMKPVVPSLRLESLELEVEYE